MLLLFLINLNVVAFIDTLPQVLQMFLYYSTVYTIFKVYCPDTHSTSIGSCILGFSSGAVMIGPNILWSTPPPSRNPP